jgi:tryptophan synthase alpha chain
MNRIERKFEELKKRKEKALVGFITAGDPDVAQSLEIICAMCAAGLDILELGIPFSDPTADGPAIQRSSARALAHRVNISQVLEMTRILREKTDIPIILFGYYNPIFKFRVDQFCSDARAAGADGVLVVDLPPEESAEMTNGHRESEFPLIHLIAPTTPAERMRRIAASAHGFLYLISKTGVTGSDGLALDAVAARTVSVKAVTGLPVCVGFGISTPADVRAIAAVADGVVIGSAFERLIEENLNRPDLPEIVAEQVRAYKQATR